LSPWPSWRGRTTLDHAVSLSGVGLHTGHATTVTLEPETDCRGILFARTDLPGEPLLELGDLPAEDPGRSTMLARDGAEVRTVEHRLAALTGTGVTDALISIDGDEVPGMDGSALPFVRAIDEAGLAPLACARPEPIVVDEPVTIADDRTDASIAAYPHPGGLRITYAIDYPDTPIAQGRATFDIDPETFCGAIAPARTFCLASEARALRAAGLGAGASPDNTLVLEGDRVVGTTPRFADEPLRHKVLDVVGDLSLAGRPIHAHVVAERSGHRLNRRLAERLTELPLPAPHAAGTPHPTP
jgi:UDP-3-O-acyl N-acetylglucosamine deacetylase